MMRISDDTINHLDNIIRHDNDESEQLRRSLFIELMTTTTIIHGPDKVRAMLESAAETCAKMGGLHEAYVMRKEIMAEIGNM
jgi:hypothetical protein